MKSIINLFSLVFLAFLVFGCNYRKESTPINTITVNDKEYYIKEALTKGDTSAYSNLVDFYMDYPIDGMLYQALIMANKYDYHLAYLNVYESLTSHDHKMGVSELEDLDPVTRKMALDYLIKGAKKGNKECKRILGNHYLEGKYVEKDTVIGKQLIEEGER